MIKEAIEKILSLATPWITEIDGFTYSNQELYPIRPPRAEDALNFASLTGFAAHATLDREAISKSLVFIHVRSPYHVELVSTLNTNYRDRDTYSAAHRDPALGFKFGQIMKAEEFVIALQTLFDHTADQGRLLSLVGNMKAEKVDTAEDDGVSQKVARRAGITLVATERIANPFNLQPHRTFAEVEQPASPFILRVHQRGDDELPQPALYECDNGAWKLSAMNNIKAWLEGKVGSIPVLA